MQHALAVPSMKHHQWSNALPSGFPTSVELMGEGWAAPAPSYGLGLSRYMRGTLGL